MSGERPFSALRVLDLSTESPARTRRSSCAISAPTCSRWRSRSAIRCAAARVALPEGEDSALFRFLNSLNYLSSSSVSRTRFWSVQIPRMGGELCSLQGTGAVMHRC